MSADHQQHQQHHDEITSELEQVALTENDVAVLELSASPPPTSSSPLPSSLTPATTCNTPANEVVIETVPKNVSDKLILEKIASLNIENHELKTENEEFKGKVTQLEKTCHELKQRSDRATASIESTKRELQSMVIKYATSEKEVINLKKHHSEIERKCKEALKERESLQAKIKELTAEKKQLLTNVERTILEAATLRNENELLKNKLAQADVRLEQLHLQLTEIKSEYSRAKQVLDQIESGIGQAVELQVETPVRQNTQFKLVDDEELELSKTEEEGESAGDEEEDEEKITAAEEGAPQTSASSNWTTKYLQCIERNKLLTSELERVTHERAEYRDHIDRLEAKLAESRDRLKDYVRKVELIEELKNELINKQNSIDTLKSKFDQINSINRDLVGDIDSSKHKEGELLEYTERLTAKLVSLQSEHNILTEKLKCTEAQCQQLKGDHAKVSGSEERIKAEFEGYRADQEAQMGRLKQSLEEKVTETEELKRKVDELENDIKIIKRKHITSLKELNKEITVLKRARDEVPKVKVVANQNHTDAGSSTLSSRTNSFNSLSGELSPSNCDSSSPAAGGGGHDQQQQHKHQNGRLEAVSSHHHAVSNTTSLSDSTTSSSSSAGDQLITTLADIDKNSLIERILRQQRTLIKRNERIEFLEEHNEQLTEEVRKKRKLLQYYILKEEAGALATETMDKNKAYLSKRGGGIMASLYNSSSTDDTMTLERSLEINSKLHAVLEDTLLKNMTLKENLNTLAGEIDRLSKSKK
ncbi:hypothetical protein TYRP_010934 [Tyrophagus putrescentiae]|nr:hypothetical protein TYRP_010934 [Tyrophagus putrescentiae]